MKNPNQGMKFVILCQVLTGESPIQIRWFKDSKQICQFGSQLQLDGSQCSSNGDLSDSGEQLGIELNQNEELGASLYFRFVQAKHAGNYTCIASNQFGSASYSSQMSVKGKCANHVEPLACLLCPQQSVGGKRPKKWLRMSLNEASKKNDAKHYH